MSSPAYDWQSTYSYDPYADTHPDAYYYYYASPVQDAPLSPSSSASCSSASSCASSSPLTPAYHAPPLPGGLLYTKLDSPAPPGVPADAQEMMWDQDLDMDEGLREEEGDTIHAECGYAASGTGTGHDALTGDMAYAYPIAYSPAQILASPPTALYPPPPPPVGGGCLSPAQTQLPKTTQPLEIKQPQPKPIIPVISLSRLASEAEAAAQPKPPVFSRPVLSVALPQHQHQQQQLSPLGLGLDMPMDVQSPTSYTAYTLPNSFQSAMLFAGTGTGAPPPHPHPPPPPQPCCSCVDCAQARFLCR